MFASDFKETRSGRIAMDGLSKELVEVFLEYLYTQTVRLWAGRELDLLSLADK